ncbi:hypothetical protein FRB96_000274 [Tulasnella sp. 330]|nr:hypothetical protein FRB96_000274 [Tulasnella sp. 330]
MANIRHDRSYASPSNASRLTHIPNRRDRSASEFGTVASRTPLLRQPIIPGNATNDVAVTTEVPSRYSWKYFKYPDEVFVPTFNRRQVTMIGISNAIGTGLFLSSGQALENAGPLGILLGYAGMSFLMYCIVVSYAEMASVYPNCQGTIALANRFVDPALGFAMGWNAWAFWGLTIASQTAAAISLIRYWGPPVSLEPLWPSIAIVFSIAVVFSSRWYGNLETGFAMIKVFGVLLLIMMGIVINVAEGITFWKKPVAQYDDIGGPTGRGLAFLTGFTNALFPFLGCETATYLAAEIKDAPRVVYPLCKRTWARVSILYLATVFVAGTLPPPGTSVLDQPWVSSSFWLAMHERGGGYAKVCNLLVTCFLVSAASAAAVDVYMSTRILSFLAQAGHAPKWLGLKYSRVHSSDGRSGTVIPLVGLLTSLGFAALSFMCMAPKHGGGELKDEVIFKQLTSMNTSAYLQAIIGTLFTYIRFYHGTKHQENKYKDEIKRIKDNRARGQPYVDTSADPNAPVDYQTSTEANTFLVTYLPPPILLLLVFGYKLIKRSPMTSVEDMDFSDVEFVRGDPIEPKPQKGDLWGRAWWTLAK